MNASTTSILDQVALVNVEMSYWRGEVSLKEAEIEAKKLPKELIKLGSKRVIDKKPLIPFGRLYADQRTLLASIGMRFMGGYAIPLDRIDEVDKELTRIANQVKNETQDFVSNYKRYVSEWADINDNHIPAQVIKDAAPSLAWIESRFGFEHAIYRMNPADEVQASRMENQAKGLINDLFNEISQTASEIFHNKMKGKDVVKIGALEPLLVLEQKVAGLRFLDSRFEGVATQLSFVATKIQRNPDEKIWGPELMEIMGFVVLLADSSHLRQHISSIESAKEKARLAMPQVNTLEVPKELISPRLESSSMMEIPPKQAVSQMGFF